MENSGQEREGEGKRWLGFVLAHSLGRAAKNNEKLGFV